jgi:hypothetical protein
LITSGWLVKWRLLITTPALGSCNAPISSSAPPRPDRPPTSLRWARPVAACILVEVVQGSALWSIAERSRPSGWAALWAPLPDSARLVLSALGQRLPKRRRLRPCQYGSSLAQSSRSARFPVPLPRFLHLPVFPTSIRTPARGIPCLLPGPAAARSLERATANSRPPPIIWSSPWPPPLRPWEARRRSPRHLVQN